MIDTNDKAEFLGEIIDIFEDFLTKKGIAPFNTEPIDEFQENDLDNPVYIYGDDYYEIEDALTEIMKRWGVIN